MQASFFSQTFREKIEFHHSISSQYFVGAMNCLNHSGSLYKNPILLLFFFWFCSIHSSLLHADEIRDSVLAQIQELKGNYAQTYHQQAKEKLIRIGGEGIPHLAAFLTDEDPELSSTLLEIISEIGDRRSATFVLSFLEKSESVELIVKSVLTLGKLKSILALRKLIALLQAAPETYFFDKEREDVIQASLWSIGEIGDPSFVPEIFSFLKAYPKAQYFVYAAEALGKIRDPRAKGFLLNLLKHREESVRLSAAKALLPFAESAMLKEFWTAFEYESDFEAQSAITDLLIKIGGDKTIQKWIELLHSGQNYTAQRLAEKGLKALGEKSVPLLLSALDESDMEQKVHVIRILAELGSVQSAAKLAELAQSNKQGNNILRLIAVEALGNCGDASSLGFLTRVSLSFNPQLRRAARAAKEKILKRIEVNKDEAKENLSR